jgi:hypothetical protein
MASVIERSLDALGSWLIQADIGLGLLLLVGLSMALSHVFALLANRLTSRQIGVHLLLDALMLSVAFLLSSSTDMLLLSQWASKPVHPTQFLDGMAACLLPACFYVLVAAPYVGNWIAAGIWLLIHLNVLTLLHVRFGLAYEQAFVLATPGFALALLLVWILFRQSWRTAYTKLASELPP